MSIRTILVHLDLDQSPLPRLSFAQDLARRFSAHISAIAAADPHVFVPGDDSGMVSAELLRRKAEEITERLNALKDQAAQSLGERSDWISAIADPTETVSMLARTADLVVTGRDTSVDRHNTLDIGSLILSAGRPVLVASDELSKWRADCIVIAWKDAREARRALADSLPFCRKANEVLVVTVAGTGKSDARHSVFDVVSYLDRHGVAARGEVVPCDLEDEAETISHLARRSGADLVVSGGYGHSRLREWAIGGMTRSLLADGTLNRLFSN